eukprot:Pgem_evm1s9521
MHVEIRRRILQEIANNEKHYLKSFNSKNEFDEYVEKMKTLGNKGDSLILEAASNVYATNIV